MPDGPYPSGIFLFSKHIYEPRRCNWESAQRELARILLDHIRSLGLIFDFTYSRAVDLVHSMIDFPELFQYPVCLTKEADIHECAQDT